MLASVHAFQVLKSGSTPREYEDAAWPRSRFSPAPPCRFAIADGATESAFAAMWAQQLVRAYGAGRLRPGTMDADLVPLRTRWAERLGGRALPWYTQEKVRLGAFATFAGLTLEPGDPCRWSAMAVGDSCVFHVRGGELVAAFPIASAANFDSQPTLVASVAGRRCRPLTADGAWLAGDVFYLMTDALARWFLCEHAQGRSIARLHGVRTRRAFAELVERERATRDDGGTARLANDDTTLLRVRTLPAQPASAAGVERRA